MCLSYLHNTDVGISLHEKECSEDECDSPLPSSHCSIALSSFLPVQQWAGLAKHSGVRQMKGTSFALCPIYSFSSEKNHSREGSETFHHACSHSGSQVVTDTGESGRYEWNAPVSLVISSLPSSHMFSFSASSKRAIRWWNCVIMRAVFFKKIHVTCTRRGGNPISKTMAQQSNLAVKNWLRPN